MYFVNTVTCFVRKTFRPSYFNWTGFQLTNNTFLWSFNHCICFAFLKREETFRFRQWAYVAYVRTATFIGVSRILDMRTLTPTLIFSLWFFKVFKNFLILKSLYCLRTYCHVYLTFNLFVLGKDRFFNCLHSF